MKDEIYRRPKSADSRPGSGRIPYRLTAPLIQAGVEKKAGDIVKLTPAQAERLKDRLTAVNNEDWENG